MRIRFEYIYIYIYCVYRVLADECQRVAVNHLRERTKKITRTSRDRGTWIAAAENISTCVVSRAVRPPADRPCDGRRMALPSVSVLSLSSARQRCGDRRRSFYRFIINKSAERQYCVVTVLSILNLFFTALPVAVVTQWLSENRIIDVSYSVYIASDSSETIRYWSRGMAFTWFSSKCRRFSK